MWKNFSESHTRYFAKIRAAGVAHIRADGIGGWDAIHMRTHPKKVWWRYNRCMKSWDEHGRFVSGSQVTCLINIS